MSNINRNVAELCDHLLLERSRSGWICWPKPCAWGQMYMFKYIAFLFCHTDFLWFRWHFIQQCNYFMSTVNISSLVCIANIESLIWLTLQFALSWTRKHMSIWRSTHKHSYDPGQKLNSSQSHVHFWLARRKDFFVFPKEIIYSSLSIKRSCSPQVFASSDETQCFRGWYPRHTCQIVYW